ncbi:hypothetical protein SASPL_114460 [Salvia splendens]|uniref:Homeobox domain-containing protein n=1 Tax=Salvia splendens TaxID=180675 RepID=A0A8X9A222_SALSN|nr:hypothetical protein SASPL_114460 [Salvia splendens]
MGIAPIVEEADNSSMSQDFHQNIFSFSNGLEGSQIRRDKQGVGAVAMEEDGLPSYEGSGIFSEMFNFSSGGTAEWNSKSQSVVNDTGSYNHHEISSINPDPAAAMQLFAMRSEASPSVQNHPSLFQAGGAFGHFTWPPNPNGAAESLSLSLSSSAEDMRLGLLYGTSAPLPQYNHSRQIGLGSLSNSKYAKAAQDLLEEFCSVGRDQVKKGRNKDDKKPSGGGGEASSSSRDPPPLSASEKLEHQRRKVDKRYNHYCERMQVVVNSFDMVMGFGAAAPYTSLAQKAMSRHFRCLREAVAEQLAQSCEQLGEKDGTKSGLTKGETPRLKFLEQSLRQQQHAAFHHIDQDAWRPQRGLPQRSVTILRAWLFDHFLHPYPSDADKHLLARQTGLSRNQVANWFINARVRLWKPMVEEMYLQEAKDEDQQPLLPTTTSPPPSTINTSDNQPEIESDLIRFGTTSGDVSLTLGLRHSGEDLILVNKT